MYVEYIHTPRGDGEDLSEILGDLLGEEGGRLSGLVDDVELNITEVLLYVANEVYDVFYELFTLELLQMLVCDEETHVVTLFDII